jgi:hypothetical protein
VQPYFICCCEVWDIFGENQSPRLQKLLNRCARILMDMSNEVNAKIALSFPGWETLNVQRTEAKLHPRKTRETRESQFLF